MCLYNQSHMSALPLRIETSEFDKYRNPDLVRLKKNKNQSFIK
jgi:hypothetical protein